MDKSYKYGVITGLFSGITWALYTIINNMITKNIIMGQLIKQEPKAYEILTGFGMHCLGCPSSQMESLEDACMVHGIDVDKVLEKLNEK